MHWVFLMMVNLLIASLASFLHNIITVNCGFIQITTMTEFSSYYLLHSTYYACEYHFSFTGFTLLGSI